MDFLLGAVVFMTGVMVGAAIVKTEAKSHIDDED